MKITKQEKRMIIKSRIEQAPGEEGDKISSIQLSDILLDLYEKIESIEKNDQGFTEDQEFIIP